MFLAEPDPHSHSDFMRITMRLLVLVIALVLMVMLVRLFLPHQPAVSRPDDTRSSMPDFDKPASPDTMIELVIRKSTGGELGSGEGLDRYVGRMDAARLIGDAFEFYDERLIRIPSPLQDQQYDVLIRQPPMAQRAERFRRQLKQMSAEERRQKHSEMVRSASQHRALIRAALPVALGVTVRRETSTADVFVLSAPNGPGAGLIPHTPPTTTMGGGGTIGNGRVTGLNDSMAFLAQRLSNPCGALVVDETNLKDRYDYDAIWQPETTDSLKDALRSQLGLELIPARRDITTLIVEEDKD